MSHVVLSTMLGMEPAKPLHMNTQAAFPKVDAWLPDLYRIAMLLPKSSTKFLMQEQMSRQSTCTDLLSNNNNHGHLNIGREKQHMHN